MSTELERWGQVPRARSRDAREIERRRVRAPAELSARRRTECEDVASDGDDHVVGLDADVRAAKRRLEVTFGRSGTNAQLHDSGEPASVSTGSFELAIDTEAVAARPPLI